MLPYTLIYTIAHLGGALLFQFTGNQYYLLINSALLGWSMLMLLQITALVISPQYDIELEVDNGTPLQFKLMLSIASILSVWLLYREGWGFYAGFCTVYIVATLGALLIQILGIDMSKESDEE